jgi:transposase InsO family protein
MYECFGITKQAYYKRIKAEKLKQKQAEIILELIKPIRREQSKYGGRKLFLDLQDDFKKHNIKMGRDAFFNFLRNHQLLVKKTKRFHITTDSKHGFYKSPNRLKDLTPTHAEQVWVSDITYVKIQKNHAYLALVTDAYSKKIMGYKIDTNMKATLVKEALQMALKNRLYSHQNIIHHSDRGIQYCCPEFSDFALNNGMLLSTTQKYDPYENAVAERINGILKYEFGFIRTLPNLLVAKKMLKQAVNIYNKQRRHYSLEMKTPEFAHKNQTHKYKSYSLN